MSDNYLMVNKATNVIENIVLWDGNLETWNPGDEFLLLKAEETSCTVWFWDNGQLQSQQIVGAAGVGDTWDNGNAVKPQPPKPEIMTNSTPAVQLTDGGPSVIAE
jgi:hypothetical protein